MDNICMLPHIPSHRVSICVALMLSTASMASSATLLNIDITPYLGGSQSQLSWYFTGDIVSASGQSAQLDGAVGEIRGSFDNLYSYAFAANWYNALNDGPTGNKGDVYFNTYLVSGAGVTTVSDNLGSRGAQIGAITLHAESGWMGLFNGSTRGFLSLGYGQNYITRYNWPSVMYYQYSSDSLGYSAPATLSYAAGIDSYVIPMPFSWFNSGTYSDLTTGMVVNVVPEPSTYMLFGIGGIGLLVVLRRKKAV